MPCCFIKSILLIIISGNILILHLRFIFVRNSACRFHLNPCLIPTHKTYIFLFFISACKIDLFLCSISICKVYLFLCSISICKVYLFPLFISAYKFICFCSLFLHVGFIHSHSLFLHTTFICVCALFPADKMLFHARSVSVHIRHDRY